MDLHNKTPEELRELLEKAEVQATYWQSGVEELKAVLKAKAEEEERAKIWDPAISALWKGLFNHRNVTTRKREHIIEALKAAIPLAPPLPIDENWLNHTARVAVAHCKSGRYSLSQENRILAGEQDNTEPVEVAKFAIRMALQYRPKP